MEIDILTFALMLEIIGASLFLNIIAIIWKRKLIKNGYVKGKKYEYTCKPLGDTPK